MTLKQRFELFKENIGNNFVEISSSSAKYQCMDLAYAYVFTLNYPKATIQNAYAYQVFTAPKAITKEYFEIIKNSASFVPQVGDLCVWDKKFNGTAGHIAIATGVGDTKTFESFDQNVGSLYPQVIKHDYKSFLGVLRPKLKDSSLEEYNELKTDYDELRKRWNTRDIEYDLLKQKNEDLLQAVDDLRANNKEWQLKVDELVELNLALVEEAKLFNAIKNSVLNLFRSKQ